MKKILSVCMTLLLSACATHDMDVPDLGIMSAQQVASEYGLDRDWWLAYNDPQLNALVSHALDKNIDLAKSAIAVNRALYQANMIGADLVPVFSGGANASTNLDTDAGDSARSYGGSAGISYELDLWGRLRNSADAQTWEYQATIEDKETARMVLINNVINTYFNLMYLHQAQEITRQGIVFYEELSSIVEDKYRVGSVDGLEPIMARQSLLSERNILMDLENQQKSSEQTLRDLLNMRPEENLNLVYLDLLEVAPPAVDLGIPLAALGVRPDVQAAEYRLQKAFDSLGAEKAGLYPSITIGSTLSVSSSKIDTFFDVPLLGGTIRINFPFLQYNKVRWSIKISEAQLEEAELNFIQKVNTALNEVDAFYYAYTMSLAQLDNIIEKNMADAQISEYRAVRYEVGVDELQDWLQARNTENNSHLAVLKGKYSVIENENAIFQTMGGRLLELP